MANRWCFLVYLFIAGFECRFTNNGIEDDKQKCEKIDYTSLIIRGSTTNYDDVRGHQNLTVEHCQARKIWALIRHGIRNNNLYKAELMKNYLYELKIKLSQSFAEGKGHLCQQDIKAINAWIFNEMLLYEPHFLTDAGKVQLRAVGSRMRLHFPSVLNRDYDPKKFYFAHSGRQRTLSSLRSFTEGLFEFDDNFDSQYVGTYDTSLEFDCLLKELVPWENNFEGNPASKNFAETSHLYEKIAWNLSQRTGLDSGLFNSTIIVMLYEACGYDFANNKKISPWCKLFTIEDLTLLRIREEIYHYSLMGYGSKYTGKIGCVQMKELVSTFNKTKSGGSDFLMKAYFGHDAMLEMIFVGMGCFKGLPSDNAYMRNSWNLGIKTPFAANLFAVLYECSGDNGDELIQFYLNEKPMGCCISEETEPCSWTKFKEHFSDFVTNCKEDYCIRSGAFSISAYSVKFYVSVLVNIVAYCFKDVIFGNCI